MNAASRADGDSSKMLTLVSMSFCWASVRARSLA